MLLEILFEDEHYIAINKPHNLLVHRTKIAEEKEAFALQYLRDQVGKIVFPCHRLDSKTAGVLLFALSHEADVAMQKQFMAHQTYKEYIAIVRGYMPEEGDVDKPLAKENGKLQDAFTSYKCLQKTEMNFEVIRYPTSRYSLALFIPKTGRMHQLRRHAAHLRHYILGDKKHGDNTQNNYFEKEHGFYDMMLHAYQLSFIHPFTHKEICIKAPFQPSFTAMGTFLNFDLSKY
jgi:tRNA pseudouridine65 synthase